MIGLFRRARWRRWSRLAAFYLVVALMVYLNALSNPFHFDDARGIVENHHLRDPSNIPHFFAYPEGRDLFAPTDTVARHYRPVLLSTYALNFWIGGEDPAGFHLIHILLHVAGALLVALLAARLGLPMPWATATGTLFLVHPMHTEVINYISARSSLLSGVLSLAALYAFITARQGPDSARWGRLLAAVAVWAVAVLTKEVAVAVPGLFLLYDLARPPARALRWGPHGYGLHLGLFAVALAFLGQQGHIGYLWQVLDGTAGARPFGDNLWLGSQVLAEYVRLTLIPVGLSVAHRLPGAGGLALASVLSVILLVVWTVGAVGLRRWPGVLVGWGGFVALLLPTVLLPLNTPLQESRGYGATGLLMIGLCGLVYRVSRSRQVDSVPSTPVATAQRASWVPAILGRQARWLVAALAVVLAVAAVSRNTVWRSDLRLWRDAVAKAPDSYHAQGNLGTAYHAAGHLEQAVTAYRRALSINPREASLYASLGGALTDLGQYPEAYRTLKTAEAMYEPFQTTHFNLGVLAERMGRPDEAERAYRRAITLTPHLPKARVNLGILLARSGRLPEAIRQLERAVQNRSAQPVAYHNLMTAYTYAGQTNRALATFDRALARGAANLPLRRLRNRILAGMPPLPKVARPRLPIAAPPSDLPQSVPSPHPRATDP